MSGRESVRMPLKVKLCGEVPVGRPVHRSMLLPECLFVFSLLSQFKLPKVRKDFEMNIFRLPARSSHVTLQELDNLWTLLVPSLVGLSGSALRKEVLSAAHVLSSLVEGSLSYLVLGSYWSKPFLTYKDWYQVLIDLRDCPYWSEVAPHHSDRTDTGSFPDKPEVLRACQSVGCNTEYPIVTEAGTCTTQVTFVSVGTLHSPTSVDASVTVPEPVVSVDINNNNGNYVQSPRVFCTTDVPAKSGDAAVKVVGFSTLQSTGQVTPRGRGLFSAASKISCMWCNKRGHGDAECWRRKGLCLICGGHHKMIDCSRYIPPSMHKPTCSICGGAHIGKSCRLLARHSKFCHWCGRHGHSESDCWVKLGACVICGSTDHKFDHCSRFVDRYVPIFPPWCEHCGSQHLGSECDSPYFE